MVVRGRIFQRIYALPLNSLLVPSEFSLLLRDETEIKAAVFPRA
jgi:hypothetical protein